jgi:hypothetical protein
MLGCGRVSQPKSLELVILDCASLLGGIMTPKLLFAAMAVCAGIASTLQSAVDGA